MLDHNKPYVEKIHNLDAKLAGHVGYINLTWNGRACLGVTFLCLLCACLPNLTTLEWIDQQHIAKMKMGYISLPSNLNAIISIKRYYRVILKTVILHEAIKTIQNRFLRFFFEKKNKILFFRKKQIKKTCELFFQTRVFSSLIIFLFFCDFLLIARSGTSHVTISLIACAPHT